MRLAIQDAYTAGSILSSNFLYLASQHNLSQSSSSSVRPGVDTSSLRDHIYEPVFLDETTFFQRLEQDIFLAQKQVIIFSPYIDRDRTEKLIPLLSEKSKAGITITIICRSGNTSPSRQTAEKLLRSAGVQLRQPDDMKHEKFVFIDDEIAYIGSLNSLSQIKSTEFMERVKSPSYVRQLKRFKQVDDLVKAPVIWGPPLKVSHDELPNTTTVCTNCGRVLIRKKKRQTQQPFYGCLAYSTSDLDHSTESVSEHHLKCIPSLEEMRCGKCGKSTSIRVGYSEIQIVCEEEAICGYRQRVEFISSESVS